MKDVIKKVEECRDFNDLRNLAIQIGSFDKNRSDAQTLNRSSLKRWDAILRKFPDLSLSIVDMNNHMKYLGINLDRSKYLFGWLTMATEITSLLPLSDMNTGTEFKGRLSRVTDVLMYLKLKGIIFDIILDDIGDQYLGKNANTLLNILESILIDKIPAKSLQSLVKDSILTDVESSYMYFVHRLWEEFTAELKSFCDNETYKLIIKEYHKVIIASRNKLELNKLFREGDQQKSKTFSAEIEKNDGFNPTMHIVINGIIDIAYIKREGVFSTAQLNNIIRMLRLLETLGRIGDDISTWKREVKEYDFTSFIARKLIFDYEIDQDDLAVLNISDELIVNVLDIYTTKYINAWKDILRIRRVIGNVKVIDFDDLFMRYLGGFSLQLFSEGYK